MGSFGNNKNLIMESTHISLDDIKKAQRDLALFETQTMLRQEIDSINQIQSQVIAMNMHKKTTTLKTLQKKLDYFIKFKEIYDTIQSDNDKKSNLIKKIYGIECEIREKYRKLADDEIMVATRELRDKVEVVKSKIKQTLLVPTDCVHCDVDGLLFRGMLCFMCGQTIRFSS
jgi:hypothetical protein